jgi:DNA mismatch endonuclease (patch repair protein)
MADVVDPATRSRMMSGIRRRDTRIEVAIRKALHARGLRYRTDVRSLPGRPDIVLPRWQAAVLVHGCFWHAHDCGLCRIPATRREFWRKKLEGNASRDRRNLEALLAAGWRIAVVWECALRDKDEQALINVADRLGEWVRGEERLIEFRRTGLTRSGRLQRGFSAPSIPGTHTLATPAHPRPRCTRAPSRPAPGRRCRG